MHHSCTGARWRALIGVIGLFWCVSAVALGAAGTVRDLKLTQWGAREGAPSGIQSIAQTSDGYLWLSSGTGLYRFDGLRFETIELPRNPRVHSPNIYVLFTPSSGGLWIGYTYGGAAYLKDGQFTVYGESDGLPNGTLFSFAQDADGTMWAGTYTGLARLEGSRWRAMGTQDGYSDLNTHDLMVDSEGTLWASSRGKVLFLPRGARKFQLGESQPSVDAKGAQFTPIGLAESRDGSVWFAYNDKLLRLHRNKPSERGRSSGYAALGDRDGNLWFDRHAKLQRLVDPGNVASLTWDPPEDLEDSIGEKNGIVSGLGYPPILEDREGNLWFASFAGLCRLSETNVKRFSVLSAGEAPEIPKVAAMAAGDQGALWIGSSHSPVMRLLAGRARKFEAPGFVSAAARSDDGVVWMGYTTDLWKFEADRFERVAGPENKDKWLINGIAREASGALWVSYQNLGVYRLKDGAWAKGGGFPVLAPYSASAMAIDWKQRVWLGYGRGAVAMIDGNVVKRFFSASDRLPIGHVTAIYGKRKRVWIGGELGLALFDGTAFRQVLPREGAAFNNVTGIVETAGGDTWLNTSGGIVRIAAGETRSLERDPLHRVGTERFDVLDGVEGISAWTVPVPTLIEGTDGRLWFSTTAGLFWIDPVKIRRNPTPPPVFIQSIYAGAARFEPRDGLHLPKGTNSVRIDYVGLSLTMAEKVAYRYRLDDVDAGWQDAQGRRQAFYTNLPPGPHRFHVIARNNDGIWNEAGATLVFEIPPTFVQTRWFLGLCGLSFLLALTLLMRLRIHQTSVRLKARHQALMAERERIARDLHDTLLQSTQSLILQFDGAAKDLPAEDPVRGKLRIALDRADEVMEEARGRVLDLRLSDDVTTSLPEAVAMTGARLSQGGSVAFSSTTAGEPRELLPAVKDEVFGIVREALANAYVHSGATLIQVEIVFDPSRFMVRVKDDGRGIDAGTLKTGSRPGHWGLAGMRERAARIDARLEISGDPDHGTEVEVELVAVKAYAVRSRRWLWSPFGRHLHD